MGIWKANTQLWCFVLWPERRVFRKYALKAERSHVILKMTFLDDEDMFEELSIRIVSEIVREVGNKDTPPRLASISRIVRELKQLESGKTLTLGGCRVRLHCHSLYYCAKDVIFADY